MSNIQTDTDYKRVIVTRSSLSNPLAPYDFLKRIPNKRYKEQDGFWRTEYSPYESYLTNFPAN